MPDFHTTENLSDAEVLRLIQEIKQGDRQAFDHLVCSYRGLVYSIAWQSTHNVEDALDLTQEIFIRVYKALPSFHGKSKFTTWLHRIALNSTVDYNRRMKNRIRLISTDDPETKENSYNFTPSDALGQRETVYRKQLKQHITESLELLSSRQKEVFILRYYHDLDIKRIAEITKCSESSVKSHLLRAQIRLRELLGGIDY